MHTRTSVLYPKVSVKMPRTVARYGFALLATGFAFFLTSWIQHFTNSNSFDLFLCAVVLTALYSGGGPALLTATLSILLLDYFFLPPLHAFGLGVGDLVRLLVFGFVALLTSSLSARLKEANETLEMTRQKELADIANREQRRLGQDLHDGLCQILAGVRLMTEDLKTRLSAGKRPESKDVEIIESRLVDALAQADAVSRGLYPVELDTNGLMPALEELTEKISHIYPVDCRFTCRSEISIPDTVAANHLYRIAQEAVMNAVKSGKAKRIQIRLVMQAPYVVLLIGDNGKGFDPQTARKGMGLKIMSHRAREIGASFRIRSKPGSTVVRCIYNPGAAA